MSAEVQSGPPEFQAITGHDLKLAGYATAGTLAVNYILLMRKAILTQSSQESLTIDENLSRANDQLSAVKHLRLDVDNAPIQDQTAIRRWLGHEATDARQQIHVASAKIAERPDYAGDVVMGIFGMPALAGFLVAAVASRVRHHRFAKQQKRASTKAEHTSQLAANNEIKRLQELTYYNPEDWDSSSRR